MFNPKNCVFAAAVLAVLPMSSAVASDNQTYAVLHPAEAAVAPGMGRVYMYREGGIMGAAIRPAIKVDDQKVGDADPGDYFYVDLPAGMHQVSTSTEKKEAADITVVEGQPLYVKFTISMGFFAGHVSPSVMDPAAAAGEISDCDYEGPAPTFVPADASAPAAAPPSATPTN